MSLSFQALNNIRVVLVEPAGAANVGSVARVMKNMGLQHLTFVNPQCYPLGQEAQWMAVHAKDLLESAQQVATLPEALLGCQRAVATTARSQRHLAIEPHPPRTVLPWLLDCPSVLIFGPEDRGLSNQELNYAQRFLCIPTSDEYKALNLAQAVAVCAYELRQAIIHSGPDLSASAVEPHNILPSDHVPATLDQIEAHYEQLEALLLEVGFLYPHTAQARMMKLRRLFNRANLSESEVAMLRGIHRQISWKLSQIR
ncbi:MAG: RNA methyltransferase [Cyanobacteria bacterium P01_A01_bin.17]